MAIPVRLQMLLAFVAIVGIFVAVTPQRSDAATRRISASTYQTSMMCTSSGGESYCTKNSGGLPYTLLQVNGTGFTANMPVNVTVIDMATWTTRYTGSVLANTNGRFTLQTSDVEVCASGRPLLIEATDLLGNTANVATAMECL